MTAARIKLGAVGQSHARPRGRRQEQLRRFTLDHVEILLRRQHPPGSPP